MTRLRRLTTRCNRMTRLRLCTRQGVVDTGLRSRQALIRMWWQALIRIWWLTT
jgi:hypothetical protein